MPPQRQGAVQRSDALSRAIARTYMRLHMV
jgi:hypothetical protein